MIVATLLAFTLAQPVSAPCGTKWNPCYTVPAPPLNAADRPFELVPKREPAECPVPTVVYEHGSGAFVWVGAFLWFLMLVFPITLSRIDKIAAAWRRSELTAQPFARAFLYLLASFAGSALAIGLLR
jgi:hypothetical protein